MVDAFTFGTYTKASIKGNVEKLDQKIEEDWFSHSQSISLKIPLRNLILKNFLVSLFLFLNSCSSWDGIYYQLLVRLGTSKVSVNW